MAMKGQRVTVSTTAVKLASGTPGVNPTKVWVRNDDATNTVSLGGSSVAAGAGFKVPTATTVGPFELSTDDDLYAIRDGAADCSVHVLATRQ